MPKVLAVIPARSGSKSLPDKNIRSLKGKPLLAHSIEYANRCPLITKTIVSTDSELYAQIAMSWGASVPFLRPKNIAEDDSQDYGFMRHALDFFIEHKDYYDFLALIRPTSPLRPANLIEKSIEILTNNPAATSVRTVAPVKEHPYRVWSIAEDGSMKGFVESGREPFNLPRQKLPNLYFQTGDLEMVRASTLLSGSVSGENVFPLVVSHDDMVDIDSISDFLQAEKKLI